MESLLPYTGKEFLESLNDGREVWIYGARVDNIAEHPAFRNTARMIARLYDALHRDHAERKNLLTCPTEWGGFTHPYFIAPRSAENLVAGRDGIAEWARLTWGWLGRSPDYKAALLACLGGNIEFFDPYQENARRWYRYSQERVPFVGHALLHPPVDRNLVPGAPGGPTRLRQAHQRSQTQCLGFVGQQLDEHQREMKRLSGPRFDPHTRRLPVDRVRAVDRLQHSGQPLIEVGAGRQHEWDAGVADAAFGADQPLRHRGGGHRERRRDGRGVDAEHGLQHQRGAAVGDDCRVSAHQHQLQPSVGNGVEI